ncbi:MAG: serine/threonine protein kinase [Acidobacteria bacterium]|nr:serine/threonine protein kinase [Acidobacteriota bacterium]
MRPEYWQRINELFHAALAREPDAREVFLDAECAGDSALREDVESLLKAHAEASALEQPAAAADSGLAAGDDDAVVIGRLLGPYQITGLLGRGGMGVVYLGRDTRLDRPVAIKALPPAFLHDERFRARLRREAMAAAALSHPGIATVFTLEEFDGQLYLVREYVAGHTLRETLRRGPLSIDEILAVAGKVARALAAAHAHGIIHRDLKPENVMHGADGGIKVVDFGLARFEHGDGLTTLTRPGGTPGTPGYMAPEVLRGDPVDTRADQFSFGVLLYELVAGRRPFEADDDAAIVARILETEPAALATANPDCPDRLARIVATCLAKAPRDRYQSTDALAAELEAVATDARTSSPDVSRAPGGGGNRTPAAKQASGSIETPAAAATALWWWRFHQAAVSIAYILLLYPLWRIRGQVPGDLGLALFVAAVAVVGVAANVRLHLLFTSRVYPDQLADQRRRFAMWRRVADSAFVVLLLAAAAATAGNALWAALFVAAAISAAFSASVMEPATTRAAFPRE